MKSGGFVCYRKILTFAMLLGSTRDWFLLSGTHLCPYKSSNKKLAWDKTNRMSIGWNYSAIFCSYSNSGMQQPTLICVINQSINQSIMSKRLHPWGAGRFGVCRMSAMFGLDPRFPNHRVRKRDGRFFYVSRRWLHKSGPFTLPFTHNASLCLRGDFTTLATKQSGWYTTASWQSEIKQAIIAPHPPSIMSMHQVIHDMIASDDSWLFF